MKNFYFDQSRTRGCGEGYRFTPQPEIRYDRPIGAEKLFAVLVIGKTFLTGAYADGVDFDSGQGRNVFETAGVAKATLRILKT